MGDETGLETDLVEDIKGTRNRFKEIYHSEKFGIFINVIRVVLVILVVLILVTLIKEIEAVKQINHPVKYFEEKTDSTCVCYINAEQLGGDIIYPEMNLSTLDEAIK